MVGCLPTGYSRKAGLTGLDLLDDCLDAKSVCKFNLWFMKRLLLMTTYLCYFQYVFFLQYAALKYCLTTIHVWNRERNASLGRV